MAALTVPNPIHLLSGTPATLRQFVPEEPPPLASALVVLVSALPDCHVEITAAQKAFPWCPIILVADQIALRPDMLRLLLLDPPRHAAVAAARSIVELSPEQLRATLRTRLPATAADIVEYVWRRGLGRRLGATVELALDQGKGGEGAKEHTSESGHPDASTLNRQIRRLGPLTAADWRAVLRILTVFSIVFLPATLIASIWGMNVGLPGGGDPTSSGHEVFWIIIVAMIVLLAAMIGYFRKRRWL